uniref:Uncharacterized protein n=1 Tax=Rhizophora mucronata TaxID=61149 RepID=A0A2P2NSC5_RHIMU
MRHLAPSA